MPKIRKLAGSKKRPYLGNRIDIGFIRDSQDKPGAFKETGVRGERHGIPQPDIANYLKRHSRISNAAFGRFLEDHYSIPDCQVRVHCFSKDPLRLGFCVADEDAEIADDWWAR